MGMAKRKYSKRSKIEPAVMTMTFATPGTSASRSYIDLSQVASLVNRRFYRQGINWAVAGFKVSSLKTGTVNVFKLPNTWVMANSWEKGFRAWNRMIKEATSEAQSIRPKFMDFKVYADQEHAVAGSAANLLPRSAAGATATPGEWDYSTFEIPLSNVDASAAGGNSVTRDVIATGASYAAPGASGNFAVSLIEGYASSRALPDIEDPNMPDDASDASGSLAENWMTALFNEGNQQDAEVIQDLETQNNIAPYPFENDGVNVDTMYPGGANQLAGLEWHDFVTIYETNATNGVGIQRMKGGNFPCGLICIDWTPNESANLVIQIDLIPGNHRGYLCEKMGDM
jgi:hypothetical protein